MDFARYHLKRPADNSIEFWETFIATFFVSGGTFKHTIHGPLNEKRTYETLPRYFQVAYDSGIKDFTFAFDDSHYEVIENGIIYLRSNRVRVLILFESVQVHLDGTLHVYFTDDLRIISFHFETIYYQELIPRPYIEKFLNDIRLGMPPVATMPDSIGQYRDVTQASKNKFLHQQPSGDAKHHLEHLVNSPVNSQGVPPLMMRCYELSDVLNDMSELMHFSVSNKMTPKGKPGEKIYKFQVAQQQKDLSLQTVPPPPGKKKPVYRDFDTHVVKQKPRHVSGGGAGDDNATSTPPINSMAAPAVPDKTGEDSPAIGGVNNVKMEYNAMIEGSSPAQQTVEMTVSRNSNKSKKKKTGQSPASTPQGSTPVATPPTASPGPNGTGLYYPPPYSMAQGFYPQYMGHVVVLYLVPSPVHPIHISKSPLNPKVHRLIQHLVVVVAAAAERNHLAINLSNPHLQFQRINPILISSQ
eukprot:gene11955-13934_t